jgi:DNA-binding transcriptional ArsR family regulator
MEEGKVILDRRSFEALAVDTRVRILKSLKARRKTLSELAEEMGMSVSGVKEHLEVLERADLVRKMDDGHKWKYYELTGKGGELVAPKELRVWVVLSISMVVLALSVLAMLPSMSPYYGPGVQTAPQQLGTSAENGATAAPMLAKGGLTGNGSVPDNSDAARDMNEAFVPSPRVALHDSGAQDDRVPLLVAGVSILTIVTCLGILAWNRMRST